jgi:glycine betaine/proline transport system substrate-binding protein
MDIKRIIAAAALAVTALAGTAAAMDPPGCRSVRIAEPGWTDAAATSALVGLLLQGMGYAPRVQVRAVPVIYQGLKDKTIDLYFGAWMPRLADIAAPYREDGSVEDAGVNLPGVGYGLAVPRYVAEAGIRDLADLAPNKDKFDGKIYGAEAGSAGNRVIQALIDDPKNNLGGWQLVASGEDDMLGEVERATKDGKWVVFLGRTPHPVMGAMKPVFLSGMDESGFGAADIHTDMRAGYGRECPNIGQLVDNLKFNLEGEGDLMAPLLDKTADAPTAARAWALAHRDVLARWLDGVTTLEGQPALSAVLRFLGT